MNRRHLTIIGIIAIVVSLIGVFIFWQNQPQKSSDFSRDASSDASRFKKEYPKVANDNRFIYASSEDTLRVFESGTGIVFLGFPGCPWCQQLAPIVDEAARAENLDKVYYLNIQQARTDNDATYQKLVAKLEKYLKKDADGSPRIYVPDVSAVRSGEIVGRFQQESSLEGEDVTPDTFWTSERRKRAVENLRAMIRQTRRFAAIQADVKKGALLLDVRTPDEFNGGNFANSTNFPIEKIQNGELPNVDKNTIIYVYCRSGNRSAQAKKALEQAGFSKVKDLGSFDNVEKLGGRQSANRISP